MQDTNVLNRSASETGKSLTRSFSPTVMLCQLYDIASAAYEPQKQPQRPSGTEHKRNVLPPAEHARVLCMELSGLASVE